MVKEDKKSADVAPRGDQPKLTITRREWPSWVVFLFCFTSVLLLANSLTELPSRFNGSTGSALFGAAKVVIWGLMVAVWVPETIKRLKGKK